MTAKSTIREAIGVFFDTEKLEAAIADLKAAGFHSDEIGLLAGEHTVKQNLGHLYEEVNRDEDDADAPNKAFVAKQAVGDTAHALFGTLYIVGSAVAGGAVVASAGILGGAVAAAIATTAVFGGVAAVLGGIIHKNDAEYLEEQVEEGHLLLFVSTRDEAAEKKAVEILSAHSAFDPRVHQVPEKDS